MEGLAKDALIVAVIEKFRCAADIYYHMQRRSK